MINNEMKELVNYLIEYISKNWLVITKKFFLAVGIFLLIYIISNILIKKIQQKIENTNMQNDEKYTKRLSHLVGRILFLAFLIVNILVVCEVVGIDVSLLMAGISLGAGFAIENVISNVVSGFFIILNKKFKIGDNVELLGKINTKGVIEEINLRHTVIRPVDKRRLLVPNSLMSATAVKTYKSENIIRGDFSVSLSRHVNIDQIKSIIKQTINEHEYVLDKNYTTIYIKDFDEKGYNFNAIFFVDPHKATPLIVGTQIRKSLIDVFKKYGIDFNYEYLTINFE